MESRDEAVQELAGIWGSQFNKWAVGISNLRTHLDVVGMAIMRWDTAAGAEGLWD